VTATVDTPADNKALVDSTRVHQVDKWFAADISNARYVNQLFLRLVAKRRRFSAVDFKYSIFDTCYMRDCVFDSCDFTGCRFVGTNLHGSSFTGCTFDYASFERTIVDSAILDSECPSVENLKMRFARTLRVNFQQLGDAAGANKAIAVELRATELHFFKAWHANESYYRKKFRGPARAKMFFKWLAFKVLDFVWGNGESLWKFARAVIALIVLMAVVDAAAFRRGQHVGFWQAFTDAPQVLLGTATPTGLPGWYLAIVVAVRLIAFGFLISIIVRRFSRR
jgi:hypothetical protein